MLLNSQGIWDVNGCCLVNTCRCFEGSLCLCFHDQADIFFGLINPEYEGTTIRRNVRKYRVKTECLSLLANLYRFPPGATLPIVGVYFTALYRALASSRRRLLDHTQRRATVGRTPLKECSVRRRDLYLTTHNTHNRQTSMPRVGFEPTIAAGERS